MIYFLSQILKDDLPITMFTAKDLADESVEYRNNNSANFKDYVKFSVKVNNS